MSTEINTKDQIAAMLSAKLNEFLDNILTSRSECGTIKSIFSLIHMLINLFIYRDLFCLLTR